MKTQETKDLNINKEDKKLPWQLIFMMAAVGIGFILLILKIAGIF